jgi:hypothetical protein
MYKRQIKISIGKILIKNDLQLVKVLKPRYLEVITIYTPNILFY